MGLELKQSDILGMKLAIVFVGVRRFIIQVAGWIVKGKNGIHSLWNPTRGTRGRRLCDDRITLPG